MAVCSLSQSRQRHADDILHLGGLARQPDGIGLDA